MPYIDQDQRDELDPCIDDLSAQIEQPGELNYVITKLCWDAWFESGESYSDINAIIGVLECAKLEFYRRIAVDYEEDKIEENGDIT